MRRISPVKVLILGSNPETAEVVAIAKRSGFMTYVVNPVKNSPAKEVSDVSYDADPKNDSIIDEIICREKIQAIFLGVSDPLLPYYLEICRRHGLPCYASTKSVKVLSSKIEFSKYCQEFGIKSIPTYEYSTSDTSSISEVKFPVVVKPVDSGAAVGVSLCENEEEFFRAIEIALKNSISKRLIIERYMNCDDLFAYYSITNGKVDLALLADRYKSRKTGKLETVCLRAAYPSKHLQNFLDQENHKFVEMIKSLEITNGVLGIQVFYDGDNFYAYDPGFRVQGEGPHFYIDKIFNFNQIEMLLEFAVSGNLSDEFLDAEVDPRMKGLHAQTIWVLGKPGVIETLSGFEEISRIPQVIKILNRFKAGDEITVDMVGTERQVISRIYTIAASQEELDLVAKKISSNVQVYDVTGMNLIADIYA